MNNRNNKEIRHFATFDDIIIDALCLFFPYELSILINTFIDSYFNDHDIDISIELSEQITLFWNDYYFQLNMKYTHIHDLFYYHWYDKNIIAYPLHDSNRNYCRPCVDMIILLNGNHNKTFNEKFNGYYQKDHYYSYNDNGIINYLNIYPNKDLHPRCCIGYCQNKCFQDTESCILLNATIKNNKRKYNHRKRKIIRKGLKQYTKKLRLMNKHK